MSPKTEPAPKPRTPLSRARVLQAAVGFADESGIAALSMRKLGEAVGVEAMSLYSHVANKDQLLDGMVDLVFGEIDLPRRGADWKTAMRERAESARQALRHPMGNRPDVDADLARFRHAAPPRRRHRQPPRRRLTIPTAAHAFSALDSYIYGFVSLPASTSTRARGPSATC